MWGRPFWLPALETLVSFNKFYYTAVSMAIWTAQIKTTSHWTEAQILRKPHFFLPSYVMAEGLWYRWAAHLAVTAVSLWGSAQWTWANGWCYRTPPNICDGPGCGQQGSQVPGLSLALSTPISLSSEGYQHYSVAFSLLAGIAEFPEPQQSASSSSRCMQNKGRKKARASGFCNLMLAVLPMDILHSSHSFFFLLALPNPNHPVCLCSFLPDAPSPVPFLEEAASL